MLQALSFYLKNKDGFDIGNMGNYLPMNASDGLLSFFSSSESQLAKGVKGTPNDYTYLVLGLSIFYLVIFYVWSRSRVVKTDL
jgi:hypothetical protein